MDVRTFVSIPIPNTSGLDPFMRDLKGIRGIKPSPTAQMHITLKFIGDIPEEKVDVVEECVLKSVSGISKGRISVKGTGAFPNQKAPRIIWAGVETSLPLEKMSADIGSRLEAEGIPFDTKPFKPHITVARVEGRPDISRILRNYSATEFASFICPAVLIMKSELSPKGATHTIMRMCELR